MENPQWWEKPRQPTGCKQYHYMRGIHSRGNAEATTSRPLPRHTRRRLHRGGNDLSLSLSLSHSLTLCTTTLQLFNNSIQSVWPKSYLYLYDFSAYLHLCPPNRSVPIGAGSAMSRFSTSCIRFHPEGHVSQQTPPSLRHGMSFQSDLLSACLQLVGTQHLGQHV